MKKLLLILFFIPLICYAGTGGLKTVKESGGDYSSLTAWDAGEQGVLRTTATASIEGSWSSADTSALDIDGWTTFSTSPVLIVAIGNSRHSGIWSNSAYRIVTDRDGQEGTIGLHESNIVINGIQIENNGNAATADIIGISSTWSIASYKYSISNCIIRYTGSGNTTNGMDAGITFPGTGGSSGTAKVWNNILYNWGQGIQHSYATAIIYNNTLVNCDSVPDVDVGAGIVCTGTNLYLKNNLVQGSTKCYSIGVSGTYEHSNNISKDATSDDVAYQNKTVSFLNASTNYYLLNSTDTVAKDYGADLSTDTQLSFNTGIQGNIRPQGSAWDIGADELSVTISKKRKVIFIN